MKEILQGKAIITGQWTWEQNEVDGGVSAFCELGRKIILESDEIYQYI